MAMRSGLPAALLLCVTSASLWAVHPEFHVTATVEAFLEGEFRGVALSSEGRLMKGAPLREVADTKAAFIHSVALAPDGGAFLGTGTDGRVFRISPEGSLQEWAKLPEPTAFALAMGNDGNLYVGTAPDGKVYRVRGQNQFEVFFDPDDKFIWDLLFDGQGRLFVATGPQGVVYRVGPDGKGETFVDLQEAHIVRLAWDLERNLLAGSAPEGILYRVDPMGKAFVLLDSPLEEVKGLAVDRYGRIYAAALAGEAGVKAETAEKNSRPASSTPSQEESVESKVETVKGKSGGRLAVYRIDRSRRVETLYSDEEEIAYDVLVREDGTVLLATGNRGRILAVGDRGFVTLVADTEEEQVTRMWEVGGRFWLASSNLGKVFVLGGDGSQPGVYESKVVDAGAVSRWGRLEWRVVDGADAGPAPRFFVRVGNTKEPDQTWTDWSGPCTQSLGSPLEVDAARYLQWKVEFSAAPAANPPVPVGPAVDSVSVSYQHLNLPPTINRLEILASGVAFLQTPTNPTGAAGPGGPDGAHMTSLPKSVRQVGSTGISVPRRQVYVPGARSFSWKADDPNGDDLVFDLYLRREGRGRWFSLAKDVTETEYTMDGASLPDGIYYLKVVASDRVSNAPGEEFEFELISKPFVVANRVPAVEWVGETPGQSGEMTIQFVVVTPAAPLYRVEYRIDGKPWWVADAKDGIIDSTREEFELVLRNLSSGGHDLEIRCIDVVGNIGTYFREITIR